MRYTNRHFTLLTYLLTYFRLSRPTGAGAWRGSECDNRIGGVKFCRLFQSNHWSMLLTAVDPAFSSGGLQVRCEVRRRRRQTNKPTDKQTDGHRNRVKPPRGLKIWHWPRATLEPRSNLIRPAVSARQRDTGTEICECEVRKPVGIPVV